MHHQLKAADDSPNAICRSQLRDVHLRSDDLRQMRVRCGSSPVKFAQGFRSQEVLCGSVMEAPFDVQGEMLLDRSVSGKLT